MHHYRCRCGNVLFFDNSLCLQCGSSVGYEVASDRMVILEDSGKFRLCQNGVDHAVCNWVAPKDGAAAYCQSCQLNRMIPDLTMQGNYDAWHKMELAKRRIMYALARLDMMPVSKALDPENGLAFEFLRSTPGNNVLTGHADGVITLNIDEAEDAKREKRRGILGEAYRTLVGHFRHEIAHYFWDRYFKGLPDSDPRLMGFREVFGDERDDYGAALQRHYSAGTLRAPQPGFISTYASAHPWEDWAETWAHYLHMIDGSETARSFGLKSEAVPIPFTPFPSEAAALPAGLVWRGGAEKQFLDLLHGWSKIAPAINEIVASLGHATFYPFVVSLPIIRKFYFIHFMVQKAEMASPASL